METRKIISFGSSSFVISVPKTWIRENKLKKGDVVHIENKKNELAVYPSEVVRDEEPKRIHIDIDKKSLQLVQSQIVSAYLKGYDVIDIRGDAVEKQSAKIKTILRNLTGLEIIQQSSNRITAKDLLNIKEISITTMMRRMDNIIRSMILDSIDCIKQCHYESILERDVDLNRLAFLTFRVIRSALDDPPLAKALNMNNVDLLFNWMIASHMEKIGDQTKRIARHVRGLDLTKKEQDGFRDLFTAVYKDYLQVMKACYKNDISLAYGIDLSNRSRMTESNEYVQTLKGDHKTEMARAIDNLKSMRTDIKMLARAVMNSDENVV
tara:strand:- start:35 stop:1003 length:969 start_codon:yes stop_codon:yes gene_type:complete